MSQDIFNVLAATMDTSGLSMQSLLDTQPTPAQESPVSQDEEDVFQCGKCKKQFSSLPNFMVHKREQCTQQQTLVTLSSLTPTPRSQTLPPQNPAATFTVTTQQGRAGGCSSTDPAPQSPLGQLSAGMILSDEVLISPFASLDQNMQQGIQQLQTNIQQQLNQLPSTSLSTAPFLQTPTSQNGTKIVTSVGNLTLPGSALQTPQQVFTGNLNLGPNQLIHLNLQPLSAQTIQPAIEQVISSPQLVRKIAPATSEPTDASTSAGTSSFMMPTAKKSHRNSDPNKKKEGKLKCTYCGSSFLKNFDLQQHIRSHTGEKPFQCIVCGRAFAQKSNVKKHMETHKVWPGGKEDHLPKTLIKKIGSTDEQDKEPVIDRELVEGDIHLGSDEKSVLLIDNSYVCRYCDDKFKTYFQLKSHMSVHRDLQVYKCVVKTCSQTFNDMDLFIEHTKTHEKELVYRCSTCNKQFGTLYDLGVHQYSHSLYPNQGPKATLKDFKCHECNTKYASAEGLAQHKKSTDHKYPCPECKKNFTCERYLRRHLISHLAIGQYRCEVCQKRFKSEHYMRQHLLIHTGDNPFSCDVCNATFNRKDKLKRHKLIHNVVKRHKCPFKTLTGCEREFHRADKLKAHIISHSGIKPFKCDKCDRCFTRKPTLFEHMKLHTSDFPVHCKRCGKGFQRAKYLKGHRCNTKKGPKRPPSTGSKGSKEAGAGGDAQGGVGGEASQEKESPPPSTSKQRRGAASRYDSDDDTQQVRVVHTKTRQVIMKGPKLTKRSRKSTPKQRLNLTVAKFAFIEEDVNTIRAAIAEASKGGDSESTGGETSWTATEEGLEKMAENLCGTGDEQGGVAQGSGGMSKGDTPQDSTGGTLGEAGDAIQATRQTVIVLNSSTEAENNIRKAMDDREALMENILSEGDK